MNQYLQEQALLYISKLKREREDAERELTVEKNRPMDGVECSTPSPQIAMPHHFTLIVRQMVQMVMPMLSNTKLGRGNRETQAYSESKQR